MWKEYNKTRKGIKPKNWETLYTPKINEKRKIALVGKHVSSDTEFKKGHICYGGFKKGHKIWIKGKHHSEETKKKIKKTCKEKKIHPPISKGKDNYFWKGGITPENQRIRSSIEFRLWREAVFARDNWTCQKYGINGITFSDKAHREFHKKYGRKNNNKGQVEKFLNK